VDEAGRGPLAGPVVAAAVVLDLDKQINGINDSKKLTEKKREELYGPITSGAIAWAVGMASPEEIDRINILKASLLAMQRALDGLDTTWGARRWSLALIDGNVPVPGLPAMQQQTVVGGDARSASVAAASILAKVTRDRIMRAYHEQYPDYGFAVHKGYGTSLHRERLLQFGLCGIHRKSFCGAIVQTQTSLDLQEEKMWQK
jgi:ribonuclease HII